MGRISMSMKRNKARNSYMSKKKNMGGNSNRREKRRRKILQIVTWAKLITTNIGREGRKRGEKTRRKGLKQDKGQKVRSKNQHEH
jgi:hypothetical protein